MNTELLDKIAKRIIDEVNSSEEYNVRINWNETFEIDEKEIHVKYNSNLKAYDFMVTNGEIDSLDVTIDDEPCLHIEEKYITEQVNNLLR